MSQYQSKPTKSIKKRPHFGPRPPLKPIKIATNSNLQSLENFSQTTEIEPEISDNELSEDDTTLPISLETILSHTDCVASFSQVLGESQAYNLIMELSKTKDTREMGIYLLELNDILDDNSWNLLQHKVYGYFQEVGLQYWNTMRQFVFHKTGQWM